jgi:hypothetical protein
MNLESPLPAEDSFYFFTVRTQQQQQRQRQWQRQQRQRQQQRQQKQQQQQRQQKQHATAAALCPAADAVTTIVGLKTATYIHPAGSTPYLGLQSCSRQRVLLST